MLILSMNVCVIVSFKLFLKCLVVSFFPHADLASAARGRVSYLESALARVPEPKSFSFFLSNFQKSGFIPRS